MVIDRRSAEEKGEMDERGQQITRAVALAIIRGSNKWLAEQLERNSRCACGSCYLCAFDYFVKERSAASPHVVTDADVERAAIALLNVRGFGFTTTPEEGGQDLYDISCQALEETRAALEAFKKGMEED